MAKRDLLAELRTSKLSLLWPILFPLTYTVLFVALKPVTAAGQEHSVAEYGLYVFVGFALWQVWFDAMRVQMDGVRRNRALLASAGLTPVSVLASGVFSAWIHTSIRCLPAAAFAFALRTPSAVDLLLFFACALFVPVNGAVIGLALQPFSTLYTDVGRVVQSVSMALLVSGGVFYTLPVTLGRDLVALLALNPVGPLLAGVRAALLGQPNVFGEATWIWMLASAVLAWIGLGVARRVLPVLLERTGA